MKQRLISMIILVLLFCGACSEIDLDQDIFIANENSEPTNFHSDFDVSMQTAHYVARLISKERIKEIRPVVYGRSDTVMYIVEYVNGWAVLSGDKRAVPVLGQSKQGSFRTQELNPGSAVWFNNAANEILSIKMENREIDKDVLDSNLDYRMWVRFEKAAKSEKNIGRNLYNSEDTGTAGVVFLCKVYSGISRNQYKDSQIGPLISTKWGQGMPWNSNLPETMCEKHRGWEQPPTGCVATAMAQILYFTHYKFNVPSGLYHKVVSEGLIYDSENYNVRFTRDYYMENSSRWDYMPLKQNSYGNCSYVCDLMADVGNRLNMKYLPDESGSYLSKDAMAAYGLTYDEKDYDIATVLNSLNSGMPILISAYWNKSHSLLRDKYSGGHQWIIDGYVNTVVQDCIEYEWQMVYLPLDPEYEYHMDSNGYPTDSEFYDRLYLEYGAVDYMPVFMAAERGINNGDKEMDLIKSTVTTLLMNWGWDGYGDEATYSTAVSSIWRNNGHDYQYLKKIQYNIRPVN